VNVAWYFDGGLDLGRETTAAETIDSGFVSVDVYTDFLCKLHCETWTFSPFAFLRLGILQMMRWSDPWQAAFALPSARATAGPRSILRNLRMEKDPTPDLNKTLLHPFHIFYQFTILRFRSKELNSKNGEGPIGVHRNC